MPSDTTQIASNTAAGVRNGTPLALRIVSVVVVVALTMLFFIVWYNIPAKLTPLAIPFAGLGLLLAIKYPALVAMAFLFLSFFKIDQISYAIGPIRNITTGLSALTTFAILWHLVIAKTTSLRYAPPIKHLLLLWALMCLSGFFAYSPDLAAKSLDAYTKTIFLVFAMIALFNREHHVDFLVWIMLLGGALLSLCAIWYAQFDAYLIEGTRAAIGYGTLSNPNDLATILLQPFAFAVALVFGTGSRLERRAALIAIGLISIAIVLGQSRAALIAIVLLLGIMGLYFVRSKLILLTALPVIAIGGFVMMDVSSRSGADGLQVQDASAIHRLYAWEAAIRMAEDDPLTGVGIGNFASKFRDYTPVEIGKALTAHSNWFLVLGEGGWPALAALVGLSASCVLLALRNINAWPRSPETYRMYAIRVAMLANFVGYFVMGSFNNYVYEWPLQFLILMSVLLYHLKPPVATAPVATAPEPTDRREPAPGDSPR